MFLSGLSKRGIRQRGDQWARGAFLVLMTPADDDKATFRGLVRSVFLTQMGHFMMGSLAIHLKGEVYAVSLSGAYGGDGLTCSVPRPVYELGTDLPDELRKAWNEGGGHNSAGSEALLLDAWAKTLIYPASTFGADRRRNRQ